MKSTVSVFIVAILATSMAACALDPDTAETTETLAWAEPGAESAVQNSLPEGWAPIDVAGSPKGTVLFAPDAEPNAACPSGFACLYQNINRGGFRVAVQSGIGLTNLNIRCSTCTNGIHGNNGTFNDQMSSWENKSGRRYCWWFNAGPSGEVHTMSSGSTVNVLARENDQASAFGPC